MTADLDRTSTSGQFPLADAGMDEWVAKEAPKAKLNMGIAVYGFDTNNANPKIWAKYQVCVAPLLPPTVVIDSDLTIDDKAQHVVTHNFGGAYVTSLELDDFAGGTCVPGNYPVFRRIKAIISN
ncbi:acidic mammalian chitinase-like [Hippocampus comes]|uniref:acidic mammalian chitinase-like n=1 Tax=Hippocampus comes TaxID=109280 RepID=UPI00094E6617|nr:PREDICTED: acidic mammalian chitinase-like [Hippocampus comes]